MGDGRTFVLDRVKLDDVELRTLGDDLARVTQALMDLKGERKSTLAEIAARWNALEKQMSELTTKINLRYADREIEVIVLMETPRPGMKRLVRLDNSTHSEVPMSREEMQGSFGFGVGETPEEKPDERPDDTGA